jgi:spore maturation protein CgeB
VRLAVFGLSMSSSWGNGHATLWRSLAVALDRAGHRLVFFERDVPYYAAHRDAPSPRGCSLVLYRSWGDVERQAVTELERADAAIVTSYCPDAAAACRVVFDSPVPVRAFYDMDSPVTLARLEAGEVVPYLPSDGLGDFDLVLSFAGGAALGALEEALGARRVVPLYGSADAEVYRRVPSDPELASDLSYLGTYGSDRRAATEELFVGPAALAPRRRFLLGGALYPDDVPWRPNIRYREHVPPPDHPRFYSSSRLTLNVTRASMARFGHCPSGRLFEVACCGTPIVSDVWPGLEAFFDPGDQIRVVRGAHDVLAALEAGDGELARMGARARERVLEEHSSETRASELVCALFDSNRRDSGKRPNMANEGRAS